MSRITALFTLAALAAAPAVAGTKAAPGAAANSPDGVLMLQRNVYIPVEGSGDNPDGVLVVQKRAFIPVEETAAGKQSGQSRQASARPDMVFVLVPDKAGDGASSGKQASSGKEANEKRYTARRLDQVARNTPRCSKLTGRLPADCYAQGGTGAAATASTQGQSGG